MTVEILSLCGAHPLPINLWSLVAALWSDFGGKREACIICTVTPRPYSIFLEHSAIVPRPFLNRTWTFQTTSFRNLNQRSADTYLLSAFRIVLFRGGVSCCFPRNSSKPLTSCLCRVLRCCWLTLGFKTGRGPVKGGRSSARFLQSVHLLAYE